MKYYKLILCVCIISLLVSEQAYATPKNSTDKIRITQFVGGCFNAHKGARLIMWCA